MRSTYLFFTQIFLCTILFFPFCITAKEMAVENEDVFLLEVDDDGIDKDSTRLAVARNISMNDSIDKDRGNIMKNGVRFIHNFGKNEKGEYTNTFVGKQAGSNFQTPIGSNNVGIGVRALRNLRSGSNNTAIGALAMSSITRGTDNIAIGQNALLNSFLGTENIVIGNSALESAVGQIHASNIAIGTRALQNFISGSLNIVIGTDALSKNTGNINNNIAIGNESGINGGNNNITIGNKAGSSSIGASSNSIIIGSVGNNFNNGNAIIIGSSEQNKTFIAGIYNTKIANPQLQVVINERGQLGTVPSSKKYKRNIRTMKSNDSKSIDDLNPVIFVYNNDESETEQYGLIAEEVDEVFPTLVVRDENDEPISVRYDVLPILLLNELKQLKQEVSELRELKQEVSDVSELRQAVIQLQEKIDHFMAA